MARTYWTISSVVVVRAETTLSIMPLDTRSTRDLRLIFATTLQPPDCFAAQMDIKMFASSMPVMATKASVC